MARSTSQTPGPAPATTPGPNTRARSRQHTPQPPAPASAARARPTALPPALVGTSSGYGAPGRPVLRGQIATASTTLSAVLETADAPPPREAPRPRAMTRRVPAPPSFADEEIDAAAAGNGRLRSSRSQSPRRAGAPAAADPAEGAGGAAEMARNGTIIDQVVGYAAGRAAPTPPRQASPEHEPGTLAVAARTVPRYASRAYEEAAEGAWYWSRTSFFLFLSAFTLAGCCILVVGFFFAVPHLLTLGKLWAPLGEKFFMEMNQRLAGHPCHLPPSELERLWMEFRTDYSFRTAMNDCDFNKTQLDMRQSAVLGYHAERLTALEQNGKLHDETLRTLEEMLPRLMSVQVVDGEIDIPVAFWQALEQKLSSDASAPLWQAFIASNKRNMEATVAEASHNAVQHAVREGHVISGQMFTEAVAKNYEWLDVHFKDEMRKVEHEVHADIRRIAAQTTTDLIASTRTNLFSSKELELLAKANQVRAAYDAIRQVNYFSTGLAARVNPDFTSPTFGQGTFLQKLRYNPHPPITALTRWEEATDCWCAAPSSKMGNAQITVLMNHVIFPERLVIEHIPAIGTLNISTAPRNLEVWVQRLPGTKLSTKQLQATIYEESGMANACEGPPPTRDHVCVGVGKYEIHTEKTVQSIPMMVDMASLGLAAKTVTVRATKNWGGLATCFYRLRMTGTRVNAGLP
ncbi:hypothetical protein LTR59_008646 [Friedmanniomyces endolithicus]|nr:hypothetical protein LTR59_008646 [Friedmanniomyces endolithicus]KAK0802295.1 hypothetical protein LTR75_008338 [Friedmanniomyces endolithicus]KAK0804403.1 hypothetical protein LTR38_005816 [Friedmanniomyces endolithicus]